MRRVIVSGASGFLGTNIIERILASDIEVVAITSKSDIRSDIIVINTEEFLLNGYPCSQEDVFINCLFPTNADGYKMANGLEKVYKMIAKAHTSGVGAFINISSQSVYASKRKAPAREGDLLCLETPYAVGKYSSEVFVNQVFSDRPHTNIRMASLLGVGYDQRIVNRMVVQALKGEQLIVEGGIQRYGFLDVRDATAGLIKLTMSDPNTWKETYNLGRNESYTLIDIVKCIISAIKQQVNMNVSFTVTEGQDDRNSSLDASSFMTDFDWKPEMKLSETITTIIRSKVSKADE